MTAPLEVFNCFQIFPQFIGNGSQGRTLAVVLVCFPYIPDNGAYIVQCDMTEIIIVRSQWGQAKWLFYCPCGLVHKIFTKKLALNS